MLASVLIAGLRGSDLDGIFLLVRLTSTKPIIVCGHAVYSLSVLRSRHRGCVGGCNTMSKSSWRSNSHCIRSEETCAITS